MGIGSAASPATYELPGPQEVGRLARRGVVWTGLLTFGRQALSTAVTAVLARLLLPGDYGLVGMVATLTALVAVFSDMGLSWATVQRKDLTVQQVHNLFWINSAVGLVLWAACVALAPAVAAFYHEPRLVAITVAAGTSFAIGGFGVQPLALLQRRMAFKKLTVIQFGAAIISAIAALSMAAAGLGYWALVWPGIIAACAQLVFVFVATGYRPGKPARGVGTRAMLHFGGLLVANGLLIYIARNMDNVLIGRVWGAVELGYYSRAYFLMTLPSMLVTSALGGVMIPALSALQHDRERFAAAYRQSLQIIALVGCPIAAGLGLIAPDVIRIVYGPNWKPVVPIFAWLSLAAVFQTVFNTQGWLFTAAGKGKAYFIATVLYSVLAVAAFTFGLPYGAVGVARAYALAFCILIALPILYLAHRAVAIHFRATLRMLTPIAIAIILMAIVVLGLDRFLSREGLAWTQSLLLRMCAGASVYVGVIATLDRRARSYVRLAGALRPW